MSVCCVSSKAYGMSMQAPTQSCHEYMAAVTIKGDLEELKRLLKNSTDSCAFASYRGMFGQSLLHIACCYGHTSIANHLIQCSKEYGVDIFNARNLHGATPLHDACARGQTSMVKVILESHLPLSSKIDGANNRDAGIHRTFVSKALNAIDRQGRTPLHYACMQGIAQVTSILMEHGANLMAADRFGWTCLHSAFANHHLQLVHDLLQADLERMFSHYQDQHYHFHNMAKYEDSDRTTKRYANQVLQSEIEYYPKQRKQDYPFRSDVEFEGTSNIQFGSPASMPFFPSASAVDCYQNSQDEDPFQKQKLIFEEQVKAIMEEDMPVGKPPLPLIDCPLTITADQKKGDEAVLGANIPTDGTSFVFSTRKTWDLPHNATLKNFILDFYKRKQEKELLQRQQYPSYKSTPSSIAFFDYCHEAGIDLWCLQRNKLGEGERPYVTGDWANHYFVRVQRPQANSILKSPLAKFKEELNI